jgi:hypothetical protein
LAEILPLEIFDFGSCFDVPLLCQKIKINHNKPTKRECAEKEGHKGQGHNAHKMLVAWKENLYFIFSIASLSDDGLEWQDLQMSSSTRIYSAESSGGPGLPATWPARQDGGHPAAWP